MAQLNYTSIPDTLDSNYWITSYNGLTRSTTFVPRNKELHQQLKQKAWKEIQSRVRTPYKERNKS